MLVAALFRHALELCVATSGASSSSDAAKGRALMELYCRDVGVWLKRPQGGVVCCRSSCTVWSVEADPIVKHLATSAGAGEAPLVVLSEELGPLNKAGGGQDTAAFLAQSLDLRGNAVRSRLPALLSKALERWSEHKGPLPRDVEDIYRAVASAADLAQATGSTAPLLGLSELPVLKLDFSAGALALLLTQSRTGTGTAAAAAAQQGLVAVTGAEEADDTSISWFYRHFFPSRCLHPAITALLRSCSPALMTRVDVAQPMTIFTQTFADPTTGSVRQP